MLLEIAVFDIESAILAAKAGANRLELCQNYKDGGTTASYGTLLLARELIQIPVFPIIRPRGGSFCYSNHEFEIMKKDISLCKSLGFEGVVLGLLKEDETIDVLRTAALVEAAYPLDVTFHRAFDKAKEPFEALEQIIQTGCTRILTSGQMPDAVTGANMIEALVLAANNRIIIMPGGGVRSNNIEHLALKTKAEEFHSAAIKKVINNNELDYQPQKGNNDILIADKEEIKAMQKILTTIQ